MKKAMSIILVFCMVLSLALTACAAEEAENGTTVVLKVGSPVMTVNGEEAAVDENGTVPVIVNGRTLLPVRALIEKMGGTVGWNAEEKLVTLNYKSEEIKLTIDSVSAYLNGEEKTLDTAPEIINGRTMLPIRFIAEGFNFSVEWNEEEKTVTVKNTAGEKEPADLPDEPRTAGGSIVIYFSATGNTKELARKIADVTGSDIAELIPEQAYTSEDINYSNSDCRANREQNDDSARPAISNKIDNMESYDTVFIGYPIWWGTMPKIINTFLDTYDMSGKTVMPFCTSGGSSISASVSAIKAAVPDADVKDGFKGTRSTGDSQIQSWLDKEGFTKAAERKIRLSWEDKEVVISLKDNKTAEDLISRLPMKAKIEDYNNTEKIIRFSEEIYIDPDAKGLSPAVGDVAVYAPWGNLCIFYKEWSYSDDLIPIGHVESGLSELTGMSGDFEVTAELFDR